MSDENVRLLAWNEISAADEKSLAVKRTEEEQKKVEKSLKTLREWVYSQPWATGRGEIASKMPEFDKK